VLRVDLHPDRLVVLAGAEHADGMPQTARQRQALLAGNRDYRIHGII
jgi:hypothetical protein